MSGWDRTNTVSGTELQFTGSSCSLLPQPFGCLCCLGNFQHSFRGQLSYLRGSTAFELQLHPQWFTGNWLTTHRPKWWRACELDISLGVRCVIRTEPPVLAVRQSTSVEVSILANWIHCSEEFLRPLQRAQNITALNIVSLTPYLQLITAGTCAQVEWHGVAHVRVDEMLKFGAGSN